MHLSYPRIYYACAVALCESLFAVVLIGMGSSALEIDLNRKTLPFPSQVIQLLVVAGAAFTVIAFISLGVVGTIGIRASLRQSHERSRGSGS